MKKKELLGVLLLLCAALALSGCSSVTYSDQYNHYFSIYSFGDGSGGGGGGGVRTTKQGPFSSNTLHYNKLDVEVLGSVTVEADGISKILWIFESGNNGYAYLFAAAKKKYPEMHALVNIMEDVRRKHYFGYLYFSETRILTATVIKYVKK